MPLEPASPSRTLTGAMLAGIATLVAANAYSLQSPIDISPVTTSAVVEPSPARAEITLASPPPRGDVSETIARPLFNASRRPQPKPVEETAQSAPAEKAQSDEHLELRGIMRLGNGRVQALIRSGNDASGVWLTVGNRRDGLKLHAVNGDVAVVESNGRRYELPLKYRSAAAEKTDAPPQ